MSVSVIKYGGAAQSDAALRSAFAADVAERVRSGDSLVIVHGGGKEITALGERLGLDSSWVDGQRVTDAPYRDVVRWTLAGRVNQDVVRDLVALGVRAIGLTGLDAGLLVARRLGNGALGFVGEVTQVETAVLTDLLAAGFVPVVAPLAVDAADGEVLNINADGAAAAVARALGAAELLYLSDVPGVKDTGGAVLLELDSSTAARLLADGTISGGMIPKVQSALETVRSGVGRVRLLDGRRPHALTDPAGGTTFLAG